MAQLTIYLDDDTLKKIEKAAGRDKESVSRWVKKRLVMTLANVWPGKYFNLFGALSRDSFQRPAQPDPSHDKPRQAL